MRRLPIASICLLLLGLRAFAANEDPGCHFLREANVASRIVPRGLQTVSFSDYFLVYYPASDSDFPALLNQRKATLERSLHFLQTELGWRVPATQFNLNRPELAVYFITAPDDFTGTTRKFPRLHLIFNKKVLYRHDFPAQWIHQLAHAAELQYKSNGEKWFYEATAGWMEGQFAFYSKDSNLARRATLSSPDVPLTSDLPVNALGASRLVELLGRPYPDVIRQVWESWSYSTNETVLDIIRRVLALNHLPDLDSYLQNYFLPGNPLHSLKNSAEDVRIKPAAAIILDGFAEVPSGGIVLSFVPREPSAYSATLIYLDAEQKSGTLAMKKDLQSDWSVVVPFRGLDHYKLVIVNNSSRELRGTILKSFDASIPAVVEYFHADEADGSVQLEWKTSAENGAAFWNLYKLQNGVKERLNSFPIPAAIQSQEGLHYVFVDPSGGAFYSLEAITIEGFASPLETTETAP